LYEEVKKQHREKRLHQKKKNKKKVADIHSLQRVKGRKNSAGMSEFMKK